MRKFLAVILLLAGLVFAHSGIAYSAATPDVKGVVRVSKANVRKAPDKRSPKLFSLRRRHKVRILKEKNDWYYIANVKGRRGWIAKSLVRLSQRPLVAPKIEIFSDDLDLYKKVFFDKLVARMRLLLRSTEPQPLELVVSRDVVEVEIDSAAFKSGAVSATGGWLLALRLPFSRDDYLRKSSAKLGSGVVDLLVYQSFLKAILNARELLLTEIEKNPEHWEVEKKGLAKVETLLILKSVNGDQIALSGFREKGFPVFKDAMILEIHGFSPFSIRAAIPANVTDFNQFDLPSPYVVDGSRSTAALAYDFFGFPY